MIKISLPFKVLQGLYGLAPFWEAFCSTYDASKILEFFQSGLGANNLSGQCQYKLAK